QAREIDALLPIDRHCGSAGSDHGRSVTVNADPRVVKEIGLFCTPLLDTALILGVVDDRVPVLIVGGSMVGLSTAAFLAWHGVPSLAVERHGGTAIHPRAAHFHLRTLEVFRAMGMEDDVRRKSEEQYDSDGGISSIESLAGKEIAKFIPSLNAGVEAVSPTRRLFLTQESLEPILREHARRLGAELRYSTELVDFDQTDEGV